MPMKNLCKWESDTDDGLPRDRFIGWIETGEHIDDDVFVVSLKGLNDRQSTYSESRSGEISERVPEATADFEALWKKAKKIADAAEGGLLVGHYKSYGM